MIMLNDIACAPRKLIAVQVAKLKAKANFLLTLDELGKSGSVHCNHCKKTVVPKIHANQIICPECHWASGLVISTSAPETQ